MLVVSFLLLAIAEVLAQTIQPCYSCATPGLRTAWDLTGYPSPPPANIIFQDECANDTGHKEAATCPEATCVEMAIPTSTNSWEFLRGCHKILAGSNTNLTVAVPAVGTPKCTKFQPDGNGINAVSYCQTDAKPPLKHCNDGLQLSDNTLIDTTSCNTAPLKQCVTCASFDGKGSCSSGDKGRSSGPWCGKTSGKLNGRDYQERGPTFLLPTDKAEYCVSNDQSQVQTLDPITGTNITRTKRSLLSTFKGQTCFCQSGDACNSSPGLLGVSFSLVALVTILPFFS